MHPSPESESSLNTNTINMIAETMKAKMKNPIISNHYNSQNIQSQQ
jgi:hypothetical protein